MVIQRLERIFEVILAAHVVTGHKEVLTLLYDLLINLLALLIILVVFFATLQSHFDIGLLLIFLLEVRVGVRLQRVVRFADVVERSLLILLEPL